jgi:hypothetical protein
MMVSRPTTAESRGQRLGFAAFAAYLGMALLEYGLTRR